MQILQKFFRGAHEQPKEIDSRNKKESTSDKKVESKELVVAIKNGGSSRTERKRVKKTRFGCSNLNPLANFCKNDVAKGCFYSTIDLKSLGDCHNLHTMKIIKKEDSNANGGNKVSPIGDTTSPSSKPATDHCGILVRKSEKSKFDKPKIVSKMKELMKWAAAAKNDTKGGKYISRKVSQFRNKTTIKELTNDSAKISFRWETESCSTTSSVFSSLSMASSTRKDSNVKIPSAKPTQLPTKTGNWITTDSEFVVLEL